jgi:hypothetical protein
LKRLSLPNTPANRAAVSRSLARLEERKLAKKWVRMACGMPMLGPGRGGMWSSREKSGADLVYELAAQSRPGKDRLSSGARSRME